MGHHVCCEMASQFKCGESANQVSFLPPIDLETCRKQCKLKKGHILYRYVQYIPTNH